MRPKRRLPVIVRSLASGTAAMGLTAALFSGAITSSAQSVATFSAAHSAQVQISTTYYDM